MIDQLLSALGYAGSALDKPGRAVRGLLAGKPDEALAALPFSDSLGLTDEGNRTSGKELLHALGLDPGDGLGGDLAGMGAEVATDPLMLLGGAAGRMLGKGADAAQVARGPRYGTTADDLVRMAKEAPEFVTPLMEGVTPPILKGGTKDGDVVGQHIRRMLNSPDAGRILGEIPEGSKILGTGREGMAFGTPAGDVLRIGRQLEPGLGRPASENVLQATRATDLPGFLMERTPLAEDVGSAAFKRRDPRTMLTPLDEMDKGLASEGLRFGDRHLGNVGRVGGRPMVIDPGAVEALAGGPVERQAVTAAAEPGLLMRMLLGGVGGDDALRASLAAGGNDPGLTRKLLGYGAAGGAAAGMTGRATR